MFVYIIPTVPFSNFGKLNFILERVWKKNSLGIGFLVVCLPTNLIYESGNNIEHKDF